MWKRVLGVLISVAIVGGAVAGSNKSDPDTLVRVGEVVGKKIKGSLPEASKVAGPFLAFKPGDSLPVEEKVRIRIRADKKMGGADVTVAPGATAGEVKLRGVVAADVQKRLAGELAEGTAGVEKVVNEIAVPE